MTRGHRVTGTGTAVRLTLRYGSTHRSTQCLRTVTGGWTDLGRRPLIPFFISTGVIGGGSGFWSQVPRRKTQVTGVYRWFPGPSGQREVVFFLSSTLYPPPPSSTLGPHHRRVSSWKRVCPGPGTGDGTVVLSDKLGSLRLVGRRKEGVSNPTRGVVVSFYVGRSPHPYPLLVSGPSQSSGLHRPGNCQSSSGPDSRSPSSFAVRYYR